jgi:feruloyl esterase
MQRQYSEKEKCMDAGIKELSLLSERSTTAKKILAMLAAAAFACVPVCTFADDMKYDDVKAERDRDGDRDGDKDSHKHTLLACDDSMKTEFQPDSLTTVLLVKAYKKGDALALSGTPATPPPPTAANDVCVVKLLVGPGNLGPAGLPSTSAGIGIEVWLPSPANWNHRIHVIGGGGWAGGVQSSVTLLAGVGGPGGPTSTPQIAATLEGAVSASVDTGHTNTANGGSFAMNPDGTINTVLWNDFAQRGIHEMAVKTKALTKAYYGRHAKYAYWDGFSTGGRQGHKEAQEHPTDFDGILAGAPAINWTRFITNELYPQIVYQRDLGGVPLTSGQLTLLGNSAINACDLVNNQHLGYIPDPSECRYDPTHDASVLCTASGGNNTAANCVTSVQAEAMNKIWYGQTRNGTAPSPALDNSWSLTINGHQLWYGLTRGTNVGLLAGSSFAPFPFGPFPISTDMVALEMQNPTLATPSFINPTGNGANGWMSLSYAQVAAAYDEGVLLQPSFADINTDNPDLRRFRDAGGKMLLYHGLADILIMPQGSINYYHRVVREMGGLRAVQKFYRFFLVPGMTHGLGNGTTNPTANPPLPGTAAAGTQQLYEVLTNWVEKGIAPTRIDISSAVTATFPVAKSRPICLYPKKAEWVSGDINVASSYVCAD